MAEVTKARTGHLIRTLFGILQARPDGMKAAEALATLAAQIEMTSCEAGDYLADLEARQSHRRITLIDANPLLERWPHYSPRDDCARRLPLKPVWFLAGEA